MPVTATITVTDPPAAPPSYTLVAFEVRSYTLNPHGILPVAALNGSTDGFEVAAGLLIEAVGLSLREAGVGFRLAAVAWFIENHLEECKSGCERLTSVYDLANETWGEWVPEEKVGTPNKLDRSSRSHSAIGQQGGMSKIRRSPGRY